MALARLSSQEDSTEQEGGEEVTPPGSEVSPFHSIVRYYGAWIENDLLHIQMELCEMSVEHIFNEYQKQLMQAVDGDVKAPPAPSQAEDDMDLLGLDRPKTPANQMIDPFAFSCPPSTVKKVIPAEVENSVTYPFDSKQMLQMLRDMLVALKFMHRYELQREHVFVVRGACVHSHDYVHLDIKPGNILVKGNHYKLGDFGLAMKVSKGAGGSDGLEEGDSKYVPGKVHDTGYSCRLP